MTQFNSIFGYWLDPLGQSCSWKMEWWGAVYKPISRRQLIRIEDIVQTQASTNEGGSNPPDSVAVQLAAIAAKLETIDVLKADIATPKAQANSRGRSFGSRNDNGGVLGSPNNIFDLTTRSTFPRSAEEIHAVGF
ncbi:hypothetical protein Tco_0182497 [Tanacetum coccineum]